MPKNIAKRPNLSDVRHILSEVREILEKQPNLAPLGALLKIVNIVEHGDVRQLNRVEFWIFELVRMLHDTGFLRILTDAECNALLEKINNIQSLLKQKKMI
ncbi:MAG: hypothetical protein SOW66_00480 [Porphyromonas sp.]|nr:hypothetical protein [Porphyromonas sp.]